MPVKVFRMRQLVPALMIALSMMGCATARHGQGDNWLFVNIVGKSAVFALNGDAEAQRYVEAAVANRMRKSGFDVVEGHSQIPSEGQYSAEELASLFYKNGFRSLVEVEFTDAKATSGTIKLHFLKDPQRQRYSAVKTTLGTALAILLGALEFMPPSAY